MAYDGQIGARETLTKARDYLQEHGRCKGMWSYGRKVCTMGALAIGTGVRPPDGSEHDARRFQMATFAAPITSLAYLIEPFNADICGLNNRNDDETVFARFNEAIANAV